MLVGCGFELRFREEEERRLVEVDDPSRFSFTRARSR
jgi:hypothetical protein